MNLWRRIGLGLAAPLLAIVFSALVTSVILMVTGARPVETLQAMVEYAGRPRTQVLIINSATTYYLAAVAVAVGFRMNLFNIGVDGQYRLAALLSAALGGALVLPKALHVLVVVAAAMLVGALWAGFAGYLKVRRGVSEVISTIMLNFMATGLIAYLLAPGRLAVTTQGSNNLGTRPIPESGQVPGLGLVPGTPLKVYGLLVLAVLVGAGFWFLVNRTRFGFDLRATGMNEAAAVTSGVDVRKMVVASMMISGAVAGLIGMPQLLGASYTYSLDFPAGLGFTGIAIALLGRNHPVGIAIGALLWGFLDNSGQILNLRDIPVEIVQITQGVIVLSVVVAYELVRRYRLLAVQRDVGRTLSQDPPEDEGPQTVAASKGAPA
ncbi:MAG: ral nucleoside transport system permease protein [Actinomycetota bacterium]|nr:ral nucleoside transport system permease protein [Actinomycetota bacterium]